MSARRIVDAAMRFEAEGMEAPEAFAAAVEEVAGVSPGAVSMARAIIRATEARVAKVAIWRHDSRDTRGRFAVGGAR